MAGTSHPMPVWDGRKVRRWTGPVGAGDEERSEQSAVDLEKDEEGHQFQARVGTYKRVRDMMGENGEGWCVAASSSLGGWGSLSRNRPPLSRLWKGAWRAQGLCPVHTGHSRQ